MNQSKIDSLIEQLLNVGSGALLSLLVWAFLIAPLFSLDTSFSQSTGITAIFTLFSVVRGYLWRRYFNKRQENKSL